MYSGIQYELLSITIKQCINDFHEFMSLQVPYDKLWSILTSLTCIVSCIHSHFHSQKSD